MARRVIGLIIGVVISAAWHGSIQGVDASAACTPDVDYDLGNNLVLPIAVSGWQPSLRFGDNITYSCELTFLPDNPLSLNLKNTTVFRWVVPGQGYYRVASLSDKISVRIQRCFRFQNKSYEEKCRFTPRKEQFFRANASDVLHLTLEGDHTAPDAVVTIARSFFDEEFCVSSKIVFSGSEESSAAVPNCILPERMRLGIGLGIVLGVVASLLVRRPGPMLILLAMLVMAGLAPALIFVWLYAQANQCGNLARCEEEQVGFSPMLESTQTSVPTILGSLLCAATYLLARLVQMPFHTVDVIDVQDGNSAKKIYSFSLFRALSKDKVIAVSWRWDVPDASCYKESQTLMRCAQYCRMKGFRYMMVDAVTLNQKAVNAGAVLAFINTYRSIPVLVGVCGQQERESYQGRFWTNFEMRTYARNGHVFAVDDEPAPSSRHDNLIDLLCDKTIDATFELDRLRVFLLRIPLSQIFLFPAFFQISRCNQGGIKFSKNAVEELVLFALPLRPLLNGSTYDLITRRATFFMPISICLWFGFLALPPTPTYLCESKANVKYGACYLTLAWMVQILVIGLALMLFFENDCAQPTFDNSQACNDIIPVSAVFFGFSGFFARFVAVIVFNFHLTWKLHQERQRLTTDSVLAQGDLKDG